MSQVSTAPIGDANIIVPEVHLSVRNSDELAPNHVAGCALWLDAMDPYGTNIELPPSITLRSWIDKSGNKNNTVNRYPGKKRLPLAWATLTEEQRTTLAPNVNTGAEYSTNVEQYDISETPSRIHEVGDLPTVTFQTNCITYTEKDVKISNTANVFIVFKATTTSITNVFGLADVADFNLRVNYIQDTITCANQNDMFFQNNGTTSLFYVNGVPCTGSSALPSGPVLVNGYINATNAAVSSSKLCISNKTRWDPSRYFEGSVHEVIVYEDAITENERQQLEGYLAKKWKIALPASHEYYGETSHTMGSFGLSIAPLVKKFASSAKFTPDFLSDCCLWLDASDPNGNSEPFTGSTVSVWRDKSGNGYDAAMNTGTAVAYSSGALNGKAALQFVPTTTMAAPVPRHTFSSAFTLFVVFQKTGTNSFSDTLVTRTQGDLPALFDMYTVNGVTTRSLGSGNGNTVTTYTTQDEVFRSTTPMIFSAATDVLSATWHEFQNGTQTQNLVTSGASMCGDAATHVYIGTRDGNDTSMTGNISEIIMYNAPLSGPDRQKIEGYLARKWGLKASLPADHPYLMIPPLP
jgi:hypothetical protein